MSANKGSISVRAQNKILNTIDKLHDTWDRFRGKEVGQCEMVTNIEAANADAKVMNGLVRLRHDDRMLKTHRARKCCPITK